MNELVSGIDTVKCNAWEEPFSERIISVRSRELAILWKSFVLSKPQISHTDALVLCRCIERVYCDKCTSCGVNVNVCCIYPAWE